MTEKSADQARDLAELIVQLSRTAHGYVSGLSPAQWSVLRYLDRANRFSSTVSAFAEFHATTRGTASQTVKSLVERGYVRKERSKADGRSAILELTASGRKVLEQDPFSALIDAAAELPVGLSTQTLKGLQRLLTELQKRDSLSSFGKCADCEYLGEAPGQDGNERDGASFVCALMDERLQEIDLAEICANFRPPGANSR